MEKHEFKRMMSDIGKLYNRQSDFKEKVLNSWYYRLRHLPLECNQFMIDHIIDNYDNFPSNFVKAGRIGYQVYKKLQGEAAQKKAGDKCDFCKGFGYLRGLNKHDALFVYRCSSCNNRHKVKAGYPMRSAQEMFSEGLHVVDNQVIEKQMVFLSSAEIAEGRVVKSVNFDKEKCLELIKLYDDKTINKVEFCHSCEALGVHPFELINDQIDFGEDKDDE